MLDFIARASRLAVFLADLFWMVIILWYSCEFNHPDKNERVLCVLFTLSFAANAVMMYA